MRIKPTLRLTTLKQAYYISARCVRNRAQNGIVSTLLYVRNFDSHFHSTNDYYLKSSLQDYRHSLTLEPGFNLSMKLGRFAIFVQSINSWDLLGNPLRENQAFSTLMSVGTRVKLN